MAAHGDETGWRVTGTVLSGGVGWGGDAVTTLLRSRGQEITPAGGLFAYKCARENLSKCVRAWEKCDRLSLTVN